MDHIVIVCRNCGSRLSSRTVPAEGQMLRCARCNGTFPYRANRSTPPEPPRQETSSEVPTSTRAPHQDSERSSDNREPPADTAPPRQPNTSNSAGTSNPSAPVPGQSHGNEEPVANSSPSSRSITISMSALVLGGVFTLLAFSVLIIALFLISNREPAASAGIEGGKTGDSGSGDIDPPVDPTPSPDPDEKGTSVRNDDEKGVEPPDPQRPFDGQAMALTILHPSGSNAAHPLVHAW